VETPAIGGNLYPGEAARTHMKIKCWLFTTNSCWR